MTYSQACVALVKSYEGCRLEAYLCPAGVPTVGYGSTRDVQIGMAITEAEAETRLRADLDPAAAAVRRLVKMPLSQGQFDALVAFVFNVGEQAFRASMLLHFVNTGVYATAAAEFARWVHGGGKVLPGLVERRKREMELFCA